VEKEIRYVYSEPNNKKRRGGRKKKGEGGKNSGAPYHRPHLLSLLLKTCSKGGKEKREKRRKEGKKRWQLMSGSTLKRTCLWSTKPSKKGGGERGKERKGGRCPDPTCSNFKSKGERGGKETWSAVFSSAREAKRREKERKRKKYLIPPKR